jgi:hypothetical protein
MFNKNSGIHEEDHSSTHGLAKPKEKTEADAESLKQEIRKIRVNDDSN